MPNSQNSTTVSSTNNTFGVFRIIDIVEGTMVDGPGLRTSIYFAGCDHRCPGCHNPQTWAHDAGRDIPHDELLEIIRNADFNVTLTGGDPVYQAKNLKPLLEGVQQLGKTVWLYTGFTLEEMEKMPLVKELFPYLEAIVDGPFIESERDISLPFRGSANQRIIYLKDWK